MISSDGCKQLVAGNYDVIINEPVQHKTVMTNFLENFKKYESEVGQPECAYIRQFRLLKKYSKSLKENKANLIDGELDCNQRKNRYKDIIPFNHTRVILDDIPDSGPGSSYINANYVRGPSGSARAYIACQGPLHCTLDDFWRMIWECNVSVIIMACNEHESGAPKCELYWPDQLESSHTYGNIQVTLRRVRQLNSDFLIRKFTVKLLEPLDVSANQQQVITGGDNNNTITTSDYKMMNNNYMYADNTHDLDGPNTNYNVNHHHNHLRYQQSHGNNATLSHLINHNGSIGNSSTSNESINTDDQQLPRQPEDMQLNRAVLMERTICQFHYTTWPDHGVPDSVHPILELVRLVREVQPAEDKPILVHCSAGCGRTGTICCIDYVWGLMRLGKLDSNFSLYNIISDMREQRMSMVQTLEQYILCHQAVASLFMQQLQLIDNQTFSNNLIMPQGLESTIGKPDEDSFDDVDQVDDQTLGPVFI